MYFKDRYQWTEENCYWDYDQWVCETITHTEYWIKRSVSTDQHHWSTPQNVLQVKGTTGNPVVIEKQDGSYIMYYKDKYVWTEENCEWDRWLREWVCETITHTEYWIYKRTSSDGLVWGSPSKVRQTVLNVRNIAAIQKQNGSYLMCYTDKVGSSYYIRQITSTNGTSWGSPSNVVLVNSSTGNPALLQADSGVVYLAYRKGSYIYVMKNAGSGWSSPVQTTAVAENDPALLQTESEIVLIYKGTDDKCYRISSVNGSTWSTPSQIAPNKALTSPSTVDRKDRFYRVTAQYISESLTNLVKVTEYSYEGNNYLSRSTDVVIKDAQTLKSSMHFEYDSKGRTIERISKDEQGTQTEKVKYTYNNSNKVIRQDVYAGTSSNISYSMIVAYDNQGNTVYTKGPEGAEQYYSYANTSSENQFVDSKGSPVNLFSNQFYSNSIPSECHNLIVGEAFINNGKVAETYYKYDANGNLIETKTLYPTRDYTVFSGEFDENGQTVFEFDLTGKTIADGILVISSIAVPTQETFYETHSEVGKGWLNTGSWSGKYFMADYLKCVNTDPPECWYGETKIGPFQHYPGTPGYTGYTTWVEDNRTQYVKTSYTQVVNEYPETVEYKLNNSSWTTITSNLGSGTTSTTIPLSSFVQGINVLQFQESNTYSTKFEWTLYMDQGATPQEYITTLTYDTYGNITAATDPLGNTTLFGYDSHHTYLTTVTNALAQPITVVYDFNTGWITSVTDAKGNTTAFEYDLLGRVTKKIHPDNSEIEAVYDDQNNTVTIYDELDHYVIYYYDCCGRSFKIEYYLSPTTVFTERYTYNYQNKIETRTDPGGHTYSYEHDSLGRVTKMVNPDSTVVQIQYNDNTRNASVFDENLHKTDIHYDWVGNLLWVKEYTDPTTFSLTRYTYDSARRLTAFTDANENTTHYSYGLFGVTQVTYPDSTEESFSYDAVGNLLQKTDSNGSTVFTYNAVYQLIDVLYPDSTSVTFAYDENGNRITMTDQKGSTSHTYDMRNRLTSETRAIGGVPYTVSYQYDAASRIVSMTYPDQSIITYEYDSLNRVTDISGYAQFTYNADSLITSTTYGNDIETVYQYDNRNRPTRIHAQENTDFLIMDYQYDAGGNITQLTYDRRLPDQQWVQSTEVFGYDWLNRLVSAQGDYGSLSYSYDPVGNRISLNDLVYTYNTVNELISVTDGTVLTYDDNGNRTQKIKGTDTWAYTYDDAQRLIKVEKNDATQGEYVYDGDGRRIQVTENGETTTYIYAGMHVLYEETMTGTAVYVYGPTGRLAKKTTIEGESHTFYYHTDHLGSTRIVTDESKNVVTEARYQPFGESTATGEESYLYNGKEKDETGLYYYGARYYDPDAGRFITRDPLAGKRTNPQSLNRYTYCLNNPVNLIDPAGLTYRMCNVETGICTRYSETRSSKNPNNPVWVVHNAAGQKITDSKEIDDLLTQAKNEKNRGKKEYTLLKAIVRILQMLGYDVSDSDIQPGNILKFKIDGVDVELTIVFEEEYVSKRRGLTTQLGGIGKTIEVFIYFGDGKNYTFAELFHAVGHEMTHAQHFASGDYYLWEKEYTPEGAFALSESEAYRWNLLNLPYVSFPGALEEFSQGWLNWTLDFYINYYK
jgi:RHS repeat-associated protein